MNKHNDTPQVWVGCRVATEAGETHGAWLDATQDAKKLNRDIQDILRSSPAPNSSEASIFDTANMYEATPASCTGEHIARLGQFIVKHGKKGAYVLAHYGDLDLAQTALDEGFSGLYRSHRDFAEEYCEREGLLSQVPEALRSHIDFESYGREREVNGELIAIETPEGFAMLWRS